MADYMAQDLGNLIGSAIKQSNDYRQDLAQSEDVTDINIVAIDKIKVSNAHKVTKKFVNACSISGSNGGVDPFVIDHPVNGEIDGQFYIDGTHCSTETFYDDTGDL